jgi:ribonuclease HII|tara:strand:- start:1230 stop:1907 length:678 start_codon:yes stop_codon:yes gene_type:complete
MTLTIGIDDAGRGPLIGPMILAGVLVDKASLTSLKKHPIDDSKTIIHSTRITLAKIIKQSVVSYKIVQSSPAQIDKAIFDKINLNTLEAMKTAEIINDLNPKKEKVKVIVDCPSVNTKAWQAKLMEFIEHPENLQVSCEHKADANHIEAAAASILAKVTREEEVSKIKKQHGNIGSGYPSDPTTRDFLKEHGKQLANSGIFRKSWQTWQKLYPEAKQGQASLKDF